MRRTAIASVLTVAILTLPACVDSEPAAVNAPVSTSTAGDITDTGAVGLWDVITAEDYRTWDRPPGGEERLASRGPHGDEIDLYVNDVVAAAEAGTDAWPEGSIVVKEGYSADSLSVIAAMWKRDGVWFWAEYEPDGHVIIEGEMAPACAGCHASGRDSVIAFELP